MQRKRIQSALVMTLAWLGFIQLDRIEAQEVEDRLGTKKATQFLRLKKDKDGTPLALQTCIVRYRNQQHTKLVDLIGAVHIGESNYYRQLNYQFDQYDALLYELVAPEGTKVEPDRKHTAANPIGFLQSSMQSMLGLESQLEHVDYNKENFVHADLSPKQLQAKMAERGETPLSLGLSTIAEMMRHDSRGSNANSNEDSGNLFEALGDPLKMKIMLAKQFSDSESLEIGLGSRLNQLIVSDRNDAALKVLRDQMEKGKLKLGIFYGAAHLNDFEKKLKADFGLEKAEQVWVDAWDLTQASTTPTNNATSLMMKLLQSLEDN